MKDLKHLEVWFVTGSQHLYGEETLKQVAEDSRAIAQGLDRSPNIPVRVVFKPVLITLDAITIISDECAESGSGQAGTK